MNRYRESNIFRLRIHLTLSIGRSMMLLSAYDLFKNNHDDPDGIANGSN